MLQALCNTNGDLTPTVHLLEPNTGASLATLALPKGGLFGGVYGYLDDADRMVVVDGGSNLVRIAHDRGGPNHSWRLSITQSTPIQQTVEQFCGSPGCDRVSSLMPDYSGKVWFATAGGSAGIVDTTTGVSHAIKLGTDEQVANSISTAPQGMSVATDHALYQLDLDPDGKPRILWRQSYDRGPARKPGQLSHGTGASPTYFGPQDGAEYVAITDNAAPTEKLLVYDTTDGNLICSVPASNGTEISPVGSGNSVFVASTYGYPYPALPAGAEPSVPPSADFTGGMGRIDVQPNGRGCATTWTNHVRSTAVPKLSLEENKIYTISRIAPNDRTLPRSGDRYAYTVINARTGQVESTQPIGSGSSANTLQLAGNITRNSVLFQGTVSGIYRIETISARHRSP
ncbi:hypothetical protein [Sciscionella marina]|uniref:hypothetical protein n=1 Tax=Sciscionella marina TaxID=508770 RepID=UPI00037AC558|nr:hypothetical protein [Sciscionella marina]